MMRKKFLIPVFFILIYICPVSVTISTASGNIGDSQATANADLGIEVTGGLVSIDVKDAGIRSVLHEIARKAKIELDLSDDIDGRVTINAKALPLEDILKRLCKNRAVVYQYIPEKKTCQIISVGAYSKGKSNGDKAPPAGKSLLGDNMQIPESRCLNEKVESDPGERLYDSRGRLLYKPGEVLVRFKKDATEKQISDLHKSMGSIVKKSIRRIRLHRIKLKKGFSEQDAIKAYMESGIVELAERHALRYANATVPNDDFFGDQWGLHNTGQNITGIAGTADADIDAPEAWDITTGNPDIIIAVIDTGVDYSHPDLANNIWVNPSEIPGDGLDNDGNGYIDDVYGWDFAGNDETDPDDADSDPMDVDGHGTHVAGIIAAEGNNGIGIAGVCWNAKIMVLKVQADKSDSMLDWDIIEAMHYAIAKGARIVNCSFGGGGRADNEDEALTLLQNAGIIAVCAAGNAGTDNDKIPEYPASYNQENIIAVAASDQNDYLASFSSSSGSNYGENSVDVMAPGYEIKSTIPAASYTEASAIVNDTEYTAYGMAFAGTTEAEGIIGNLYNCLDGDSGDFPAGVSDNIALIERGSIDFSEKVSNAQTAGAAAVIIYNNVSDDPDDPSSSFDNWTLSTSGDWPPVVCISLEHGLALGEMDKPQATVINQLVDTSFGYMSGTSMAAPHVSGVAGLILSKNPHLGYSAVRSAILNTVDKISSVSDKLVLGGRVNAYAAVAEFLEPGDVSGNNNLGLEDIILALQVAADMKPDICADFIQRGVDVNGDRKIGLEESIYVMQKVAELK